MIEAGNLHARRLVESVREFAIFSLDRAGTVTSWNPGATGIYGYSAADALALDFASLFTDADTRVGSPARVLSSAQELGSCAEEGWMVRHDGTRFWADIVVTALVEGDAFSGFVVVARDVTPRKLAADESAEANRRLSQASRLKSDFLAKMSHELRTPLTAMLGFSDVLLRGLDGELTELQQEDVSRIRRSGLAILELVNDILDLSKIESGKMTLRPETVDLAAVTDGVVNNLRGLADDRGLYLITDFPTGNLEVSADPLRIGQVLTNLVGNAIKFTENGGVTVRGEVTADTVRIEVRDTGVGVAPDALGLIWDEFRQGETGSRSHSGTGLGLAISRRLVNMHGGAIGVESILDGGSSFWFTLPHRQEPPAGEAILAGDDRLPTASAASPETRELVLVVEDDDATRRLVSRRLKQAGFRTVEASDGAQAISAARQLRPAAITLDMVMPGVDGWSVLAALRDDPRTKDIPVIVASIIEDREMAINLGAADYVAKPFPMEDLVATVERFLPGGGARVLVVDDDPELLDVVRRGLVGAGIQVETALGGRQGLEMAAARDHDLVITDLLMPLMSGFELIVRLRALERTRTVPILVLTGKELDDGDRDALNGQILRLLEKSDFGPADLVTTVRETLGLALPRR